MIVYIIPGKTKTIQDAVDYVLDENKTAKNFNEFRMEYEASPEIQEDMTFEEFFISNADGINRAIQYISSEDKIGGFISGYLCDPTICEDEFKDTKRKNLNRIGKSLNDDTGNYFYHIIQSFPEGLEISDEEVVCRASGGAAACACALACAGQCADGGAAGGCADGGERRL